MQLTQPFEISSRLLPSVRIGDATISITYADRDGDDNRTRWHYYIDTPTFEYDCDDLQSGNGCGGSLQNGMASLLSFLSACAESIQYATRNGSESSENSDLFPTHVGEWASSVLDELSMLACEIEE